MSEEPLEKRFPLFANYSDPVVITDQNGLILFVNSAFEELTHFRLEDVFGKTPRLLKSGKHDRGFYERLWKTLQDGQVFQSVFYDRKKSGEIYQMEQTISPYRDERGQVRYFIALGRDLTTVQRRTTELQKLALVAEQSADHVLITTPDGRIDYVNPAFEELTGWSKEEVIGSTPRIIKSGQHPKDFYTSMWQTVLAGQVFRGVTINKKKNGDFYYEEKTITPLKDADGQIIYLVSVGRDITDRMRAQQELIASRERLIMMNQILEKYTQPAVLKILNNDVNPLNVPPHMIERTVFFTDMVHFSTLSERLEIEEVVEMVEKYLVLCTNAITSNGGEVIKFMGDGVMAYFPLDAADNAIRAALDLIAEIETLRASASPASAVSVLYAGVGISLGRVTEGNIGSDVKKDYTILGDTVNVASRLESLTRRLEAPICFSGKVKASTREAWDFMDLGKHAFKGRNNLVDVFSINDPRLSTSWLDDSQMSQKIQEFFDRRNLIRTD